MHELKVSYHQTKNHLKFLIFWNGHTSQDDNIFLLWSVHSPDLTSCYYFLRVYIKDHVFVTTIPADLIEMRGIFTSAFSSIESEMLGRVCQNLISKLNYASSSRILWKLIKPTIFCSYTLYVWKCFFVVVWMFLLYS